MMELLKHPWPWYVTGSIIGLIVPVLLIAGNKHFGISANLRHICAACLPTNISFFKYNWKREAWNLFFVCGIVIGAFLTTYFLRDPQTVQVDPVLAQQLSKYGINDYSNLIPKQLFSFSSLFTLRGFTLIAVGGFLVGFGTRYAGGCTSGHAIMGLSTLQLPSLIATICFMAGGFIMTNLLMPYILSL
ncbi:MAG TPA: YeeE/YedE thiosulfate transporter family protein [Chitinophagaceae bacterium]